MKLLIKISSTLLVIGFTFANGVYDSYDIPEYEYKSFVVHGTDLLDFTSQGETSTMSVDIATEYGYFSQKPGANCSYGAGFFLDMDDTGVEDVDATTDFNLVLMGSTEKYFGGNKGLFGYGGGAYLFEGGSQSEDVDDNMDLVIAVGAWWLRWKGFW